MHPTIPYTYDARPDTGVSNVTLGVWLFLASEVMLFGGLFSAYFMLRAGAATWGPGGAHLGFAVLNTVLLLASGVALSRAPGRAREDDARGFRLWVVAAIVLAVVFLGVKALEYSDDVLLGWYPRTSTRMAVYYLLTGVHALHVIGGLVVDLRLALTRSSTWVRDGRVAIAARTQAALLYWVFVDIIWIVLVVLLYVT